MNLNHPLSESDIEVMKFSLDLFCDYPNREFTDSEFEQYSMVAAGVRLKLTSQFPDLDKQEVAILHGSMVYAKLIASGKIIIDDNVRRECSKYIFTLNHLIAIFEQSFEGTSLISH